LAGLNQTRFNLSGKVDQTMAYGIVHFFPGGTKEQYDASLGAVHPSKTTLPKGQIYHAAGPSAGGWTIRRDT
jgi:hypothetical protein